MGFRQRMALSRRAYRQMVKKLVPADELAVATFAAPRARTLQNFTTDKHQLMGLEQAWRGYGETALIDAAASIPQLTRGRWGRTTALVVTDGVDTASELPLEQMRTLLSGAGIPVYVFSLAGGAPASRPNKGNRKMRAMDGFATEAELQDLRSLAIASGGRYVNLTATSAELAVALVLGDIRNRVFLGFPTQADSIRSLHTVEVRFLRKGGVVHHRTHYFGYEPKGWIDR